MIPRTNPDSDKVNDLDQGIPNFYRNYKTKPTMWFNLGPFSYMSYYIPDNTTEYEEY